MSTQVDKSKAAKRNAQGEQRKVRRGRPVPTLVPVGAARFPELDAVGRAVYKVVGDAALGPEPSWRCENGHDFEHCRAAAILATVFDGFGWCRCNEQAESGQIVEEVAVIIGRAEATLDGIFDNCRYSEPGGGITGEGHCAVEDAIGNAAVECLDVILAAVKPVIP